jgi:protein-S-isoprenylcysteine O-methyltransferase Ste14
MVVLVPHLILERAGATASSRNSSRLIGLSLILIGGSMLLRCIWDFGSKGRGTLAPVDPPRRLVVHGLYRYVRNPMYLGALIALLGQAMLFESTALLWYSTLWLACVHLFVVFYEEPALRRQFGDSYEQYCVTVHRWVPTGHEPPALLLIALVAAVVHLC